jgi:hypothetical protein
MLLATTGCQKMHKDVRSQQQIHKTMLVKQEKLLRIKPPPMMSKVVAQAQSTLALVQTTFAVDTQLLAATLLLLISHTPNVFQIPCLIQLATNVLQRTRQPTRLKDNDVVWLLESLVAYMQSALTTFAEPN